MTRSIYEKTDFDMVQTVFMVQYHIPADLVGKREIAIVGGCSSLGNWDEERPARGIEYPQYSGNWYITTFLPSHQHIELKLVLVSTVPGYILWEPGPNKYISTHDGHKAMFLNWGSGEINDQRVRLPKDIAFCTIITQHLLPSDFTLHMCGNYETLGNWDMSKAPEARPIPGDGDWKFVSLALPTTKDIEWKWGVRSLTGDRVTMEGWMNRFTLLVNIKTSFHLVLAPWEVYALVLDIQSQHRFPSPDIKASSLGYDEDPPSRHNEDDTFYSNDSLSSYNSSTYQSATHGHHHDTSGQGSYGKQNTLDIDINKLELLKTLLVADMIEDDNDSHNTSDCDTRKRVSQVSPLPAIGEQSSDEEYSEPASLETYEDRCCTSEIVEPSTHELVRQESQSSEVEHRNNASSKDLKCSPTDNRQEINLEHRISQWFLKSQMALKRSFSDDIRYTGEDMNSSPTHRVDIVRKNPIRSSQSDSCLPTAKQWFTYVDQTFLDDINTGYLICCVLYAWLENTMLLLIASQLMMKTIMNLENKKISCGKLSTWLDN